jgi:zinc protease
MTTSFVSRTARQVLPNGIRLLVLENHANPTVSVAGSLLGGSYFAPPGKTGLARLTADMLSKGTARRGKLEIAEELEGAGASVGVSSNTFTVSISTQSLSRDLPMVLGSLAEQLREPTFPADELEKLKQRVTASIQRNQEDTQRRASERFSQLVFAADNPFHTFPAARRISEVEALTSEDLRAFHRRYYNPASLTLAVVGDVTVEQAQALVAENFSDWQGASAPVIALAETPLKAAAEREVVFLKDKASIDVVMGHASRLRRANPDYLAAVVANRALGQSTLSSRLGLKVRDEMGLTYGINSYFSETGLGDGPYLIGVTVAPENVELAIQTTLEIVGDYVAGGITDEELRDEQSSMSGGYKLGLATNAGIAGQLVNTEVYGLGVNYLDEFPDLVAALTKPQINEAIRKYIHPEVMTTVIAGTYESSAFGVRRSE